MDAKTLIGFFSPWNFTSFSKPFFNTNSLRLWSEGRMMPGTYALDQGLNVLDQGIVGTTIGLNQNDESILFDINGANVVGRINMYGTRNVRGVNSDGCYFPSHIQLYLNFFFR